MQLHVTIDLPTDPRTAARLLADPGYVRAKAEAAGAAAPQVDVTGALDGALTVTPPRKLATPQIPAPQRGFVGSRIDVRQVEAWEAAEDDGSRSGTVVVEIAGAPVRVTGRSSLAATTGGSQVVYDGDVRAAVPLFAAAVEEAAASAVRAALLAEREVALRHLARDDSATAG